MARTGLSRAPYNPICDLVCKFLRFWIQCVPNIGKICETVHHLQSLLPPLHPHDAFKAYNTASPGSNRHFVDIAAVGCLPTSEGGPGSQASPYAHDALSGR